MTQFRLNKWIFNMIYISVSQPKLLRDPYKFFLFLPRPAIGHFQLIWLFKEAKSYVHDPSVEKR